MFIQTLAQSAIARARKLRPFLARPRLNGGEEKTGFGGFFILLIVFLLVLFVGLK
jgi:hypothetical protein